MKETTRADWQEKVDRALVLILSKLDRNLELEKLSKVLASSPAHFHRCFRELCGESLASCVRRLRLERAGFLLKNSGASVLTIALDCAYANGENLTRAFRRRWGLSPEAARAQLDWKAELPSPAGIHYRGSNSQIQKTWFFCRKDTQMDVQIKKLPPWRMLGLMQIGDYWQLPKTWQTMNNNLKKLDPSLQGTIWLSAFQDHVDSIPRDKKRAWACVSHTAQKDSALAAGLDELLLPGGLYAITPHFGPSETIGESWDRWRKEWLPTSSWELDPSRPSFEWYQNHVEGELASLSLTLLCDPVRSH